MGSSTTDHDAPAQVIFHESRIMREWRTEQGLEHLRAAHPTPETRLLHAIFGTQPPRVGSEREPEVQIGATFGPTHTRRARTIARIRANSAGLTVKAVRTTATPRVTTSPLDSDTRCTLTDLLTRTCAHCQGHDDSEV